MRHPGRSILGNFNVTHHCDMSLTGRLLAARGSGWRIRCVFLGCISWKNEYSGRHVNKTELAAEEAQTRPHARLPRALRAHPGQECLAPPPPKGPQEVNPVVNLPLRVGAASYESFLERNNSMSAVAICVP